MGRLIVRVTEECDEFYREMAKKSGMKVSDVVRMALNFYQFQVKSGMFADMTETKFIEVIKIIPTSSKVSLDEAMKELPEEEASGK